jgi:hypothetical protein
MSQKTEKPETVLAAEKKLLAYRLGTVGVWSVWLVGLMYMMDAHPLEAIPYSIHGPSPASGRVL